MSGSYGKLLGKPKDKWEVLLVEYKEQEKEPALPNIQ